MPSKTDVDLLSAELTKYKHSDATARNDAKMILSIYELRKLNSEESGCDIFGYRTWWLSKDTSTMRVANNVFGDRYQASCYMRPDFLYNYISLVSITARKSPTCFHPE